MIGKVINLTAILIVTGVFYTSKLWANEDIVSALQTCRNIQNTEERLSCFDNNARRFAPPTIKGKLGKITEIFTLDKPHLLRYRSHGVIFVLYLRDGEGNVLKNLHIGGRGEDEYIINKAGQYSLKVDGSAAWEIWLDPVDS